MSVILKSAIATKIAALFADNVSGDISEADLREVSTDIKDSMASMPTLLSAASTLGGTETFSMVQSGSEVKATPNQLKSFILGSVSDTALGYVANVTSDIQSQLNALQTGLSWKDAAFCAIDADRALTGLGSAGGVTLVANMRVVLTNQANPVENGLWQAKSGAWVRPSDFAHGASSKIASCVIPIEAGDYADKAFICTTDEPLVVDTDPLTFTNWGGTTYTGTSGEIAVTGNVISFNGLIATSKTAAKIKGSVGATAGLIPFSSGAADTVTTSSSLFYDGGVFHIADKVGVGTVSPSVKLEVFDGASYGAVFKIRNGAGGFTFGVDGSGGYAQPANAGLGMFLYNASGASYFGVKGGGGLTSAGIPTSPSGLSPGDIYSSGGVLMIV